MKILVLTNFGMGLYKFRKELLQKLMEQGHEVYISLPMDEYVPLLKELGCQFIETNLDRRGKNPIDDLKLLKSYIKYMDTIKPDIVLTYTIKPNVYGGIASRLKKVPYLTNVTGLGTSLETKGFMQKLTLSLYKIGLKKSKCVFFQNEPNQLFFKQKGIVKENTEIIPGSGVNLEQFNYEKYPDDKNGIRFLFIGRIMKAKGIDELLEAANIIKKTINNVEFHIIGFCEEGYSGKLEELNKLGVIKYHGLQNDIHSFIKNSHATILPSYHEGTSNVLLESASTGRPILASNVTGCKETFDEGLSGIGFEAKSSEALVEAIQKFIALPYDKKKEMGKAGRRKMEEEYDRRIVIESYLEQIKQVKE